MSDVLLYDPMPSQRLFHESDADEVLIGGAQGGGKTVALFEEGVMRSLYWPGAHVALFRRKFTELEENHLKWARQLPTAFGVWRAGQKEFWFKNGSVYSFYHCENEDDVRSYLSAEWQVLLLDEGTTFTPYQIGFLLTRLKGKPHIPKRFRAGSNPGGPGHDFFKERFVDYDPRGNVKFTVMVQTEQGEVPVTRCFIPSDWRETQRYGYYGSDHETTFSDLPEYLLTAYRDGDWEVHIGRALPKWTSRKHLIEPFEVPESWRQWGSVDWGRTAPMCAQGWARDTQGHFYITGTIHEAGLLPTEQAYRMWEQFPNIRTWVADPAIWKISDPTEGLVGLAWVRAWQRMGASIRLIPGNNDRIAGIMRLQELLQDDAEGVPFLQVFNTCRDIARSFPRLQVDPRTKKYGTKHPGEDIMITKDDHCFDGAKYGALFAIASPRPVGVSFLRR